ncbi:DNA-methyltransferase [Anaerovorax sp. IOR16]|uniref:DNA-methyltransferase n=1 Tax=Anaerovorax sp. IOR16 TaxID=2773458 RepID=UPI001AD94F6A|nr:site-specific DNA-methyltransferase [Anaerovorax sp. IOR16]
MELNKIYCGDSLTVLKTFPPQSINCCVTSPPYYCLRDYGVDGQIGLEETPEEYIDRLVEVFREVKRILKDDGTLWLNIADSYAGSGKGSANYPENAAKYKQGTNKGMLGKSKVVLKTPDGLKPKDLIGIPWMLAFALRADGWYLRQDIIWHKPNCMPESVKDRCTKAHEYIFLLSKSRRYYHDAEAIKEPCVGTNNQLPAGSKGTFKPNSRLRQKGNRKTFRGGGTYTQGNSFENSSSKENETHGNKPNHDGLRNKRSVWTVATAQFKEAHFATFPPDLIKPCILAGCSAGGIVIDPFIGSGTVGQVALENNRNFVGIDLNPDYVGLSERRVSNVQMVLGR